MHPAEFCESHIMSSLALIFLSNFILALLLGIPYNEQRRKRILDPGQPIFGQGEVAQIITSSMIVVLVFCLFLCRIRAIPCRGFRVSKVIAFITLAALNMVGACSLTMYGGRNEYCVSDGSQNPTMCYRRPDLDLPLTWFSTAFALTGIVASFALHLYDDAAYTWPPKDNIRPQTIKRDSLELVNMQRISSGNDTTKCQEEAPTDSPPPSYESSVTPPSSHVLPSVPPRKREMNKLGLTVITDIPAYSTFEFRPLGIEPSKRRRGRGRDIWERKPLEASVRPERK